MMTHEDDEPFEAQFSIYYEPKKSNNQMNKKPENNINLQPLEEAKLIGYSSVEKLDFSPIYHVGYKDNQAVYRMSDKAAYKGQGDKIGDLIVYEKLLFPNILFLNFESTQVDVIIRTEIVIQSEHDGEDDGN